MRTKRKTINFANKGETQEKMTKFARGLRERWTGADAGCGAYGVQGMVPMADLLQARCVVRGARARVSTWADWRAAGGRRGAERSRWSR